MKWALAVAIVVIALLAVLTRWTPDGSREVLVDINERAGPSAAQPPGSQAARTPAETREQVSKPESRAAESRVPGPGAMIPDQRSSAPTDGGYAYFFDNGYWVPKPEAPFDIYKDYGLMLNERKAAELAKSIEDMKRWNASDSRQVRDLVAQKENRDAVVAMYRQGRIHYIGLAANKPTVKGDKDTIYDFLAVNCNVIIVKLDRSEFPKAFVVQDSAGK